MDELIPSAFALVLITLRIGGLLLYLPVISARTIPTRIRVGLAFAVAVAAYLGAGAPAVPPPTSLVRLLVMALTEGFTGIIAGQVVRIVFDAAESAGNLASAAMGLNYGNMVDPMNGQPSNAVSGIMNTLAGSAAVAAGLHTQAIGWLAKGVRLNPPGSLVSLADAASRIIPHTLLALALIFRMGFPYMIVMAFAHALMGMAGRTAPQLGISSMGFAISIVAGWYALYLSAPLVAEMAVQASMRAVHH